MLVLALLAGTTAAFAVTEALKLERSPVTAPRVDDRFAPDCDCDAATASLQVRFRTSDVVDAEIVNDDGDTVRVLVEGEEVSRGNHTFEWDGRDDEGSVVEEGKYRLRVHLEDADRTILIPSPVEVDNQSPEITLVAISRETFSPNGDGKADRIRFTYRTAEPTRVNVVVDGEVAVRGKRREAGQWRLNWNGKVGGKKLSAGTYSVSLAAHDSAGNITETETVLVTIRYIALTEDEYETRVGERLRFRVVTDSLPFTWVLRKKGKKPFARGESSSNAASVKIPKKTQPGRYILRVEASGHKDTATVRIRKAAG